ncbi:MAG: MBL fold metallo-hydrolase [Nannocystaceae bacterium]
MAEATAKPARDRTAAPARALAGIAWACALVLAGGCAKEAVIVAPTASGAAPAGSPCAPGGSGVALQVLGSGGPIADDPRASSGYLVWVDGRARAMIDAGGGVFQRFAASGAALEDLEVVVLSHYHVDHSVDFPALIKHGYFSERARPLAVVGPDGAEPFPGLDAFLAALFGEKGAYAYLGWALGRGEGRFTIDAREIPVAGEATRLELGDLTLTAVGVPHGPVPAIGVRVDVGGRSLAFASDQRLDDPRFVEMIGGVDLLVAHHATPEASGGPVRSLHAPPSAIGAAAAAARVGHVVLSHHMLRATRAQEEGVAAIRERYRGPLTLADDLTCVAP